MKFDMVLTSCDTNSSYLNCIPCVFDCWSRIFNVECKLILIADEIPNELLKYKNNIELFNPIDGIHTAFIAQVIRILYPCLYESRIILITDADIIPCNKKYFENNYDDDLFLTFRDKYLKDEMLAICYNIAKGKTWKNIFGINNIEDIRETINIWYNNQYSGLKNCCGWFTDQKKLYEYVKKYDQNKVIYLKDEDLKFKRLDKRNRKFILENFSLIKNEISNYTDFHFIRPFDKYEKLIKEIIEIVIKSNL